LSPEWYSALTEHYASHGFVVLAPEHGESDWFTGLVDATFDRPADVTATLDYAEQLTGPGGGWEGLIDMDNVALVGHSYGGYTALAAAGARFDLETFSGQCAGLSSEDPRSFLCAPFMDQEEKMAAKAGLGTVPAGLWPALGDDRITAIVPIAGDAYLFGENGLASISVPVMAIGGTEDWGTPWVWGAKPAYDYSSSNYRTLVGLIGGNHFVAVNGCEDMPFVTGIEDLYAMACFEPVWDKHRAMDIIQHFSTAFLLDTLAGDADARAALLPASVWLTGIEYTSTLP
jgi:predicted dienelactone hydrolase